MGTKTVASYQTWELVGINSENVSGLWKYAYVTYNTRSSQICVGRLEEVVGTP